MSARLEEIPIELALHEETQDKLVEMLFVHLDIISEKDCMISQQKHDIQNMLRKQTKMEEEHQNVLLELQEKNQRLHEVEKQCHDLKEDNWEKDNEIAELIKDNGTLTAQGFCHTEILQTQIQEKSELCFLKNEEIQNLRKYFKSLVQELKLVKAENNELKKVMHSNHRGSQSHSGDSQEQMPVIPTEIQLLQMKQSEAQLEPFQKAAQNKLFEKSLRKLLVKKSANSTGNQTQITATVSVLRKLLRSYEMKLEKETSKVLMLKNTAQRFEQQNKELLLMLGTWVKCLEQSSAKMQELEEKNKELEKSLQDLNKEGKALEMIDRKQSVMFIIPNTPKRGKVSGLQHLGAIRQSSPVGSRALRQLSSCANRSPPLRRCPWYSCPKYGMVKGVNIFLQCPL
ncbi:hypothetical protein DNTS_021960 [Danionella cerebrum]|uniref:Uncharacterized protein n=1 Tax=Danionella cerebrum TaxID=2873325 RepID=A0A553QMD9_9TELE|nr:hypothetical protein DNTS_021960 [Danionella translucida]